MAMRVRSLIEPHCAYRALQDHMLLCLSQPLCISPILKDFPEDQSDEIGLAREPITETLTFLLSAQSFVLWMVIYLLDQE